MIEAVSPEANLLLGSLPSKDQRRLSPRFEIVALPADEHLHGAGQPIRDVYFPTKGCLISLVKVLDDGKRFDAGAVGYEGLIGAEAAFGADESLFGATVRVAGRALRMSLKALQGELRANRRCQDVLLRYLQFLLTNVSQVAGCNCFHPLDKHLCAWLLTIHDRIRTGEFEMTHEVLARMLGVRRVAVTLAARKLQERGLIRYSWGKLTILDRDGLKANACVCHRQHTQAYQRLLDASWPYE